MVESDNGAQRCQIATEVNHGAIRRLAQARRGSGLRASAVFMGLIAALSTWGLAYGLWAKTLTVEGGFAAGRVNAEFVKAFTDDDGKVDDIDLDSNDIVDCAREEPQEDEQDDENLELQHEGEDQEDWERDRAGCDPADRGPDPKPRHDRDRAQCIARTTDRDPEQPGDQNGEVKIINGFPSYFCTAFFLIHNNGSVPVKLRRIDITDGHSVILVENAQPNIIYKLDLAGPKGGPDSEPDLELRITHIELRQQIDPSDKVLMDLDMHILQHAPRQEVFEFEVLMELAQWNEVQ